MSDINVIPEDKVLEITNMNQFTTPYRWLFSRFEIKEGVLGVTIKDRADSVRHYASILSEKYGLSLADMPMLIDSLHKQYESGRVLREIFNTNSIEVTGTRDKNISYEIWHSVGSLSTYNGLINAFKKQNRDWSFNISDNEWRNIGKSVFGRERVERVSISDLRKDQVPSLRTPYVVFIPLPEDYKLISLSVTYKDLLPTLKKGETVIFEPGKLSYDQFMIDDRIAAICGSQSNLEALSKIFFGPKKEGESLDYMGSTHKIKEVSLGDLPSARFCSLNYRSNPSLSAIANSRDVHSKYLLLPGGINYKVNR